MVMLAGRLLGITSTNSVCILCVFLIKLSGMKYISVVHLGNLSSCLAMGILCVFLVLPDNLAFHLLKYVNLLGWYWY